MLKKTNDNIAPKETINDLFEIYKQGKLDYALTQSIKIIQQYPKTYKIHNLLGSIYFSLNQKDMAAQHFNIVIELQPNHPHAYNNLGVVLNELGEYQEAKYLLEKAIKIRPDYAEAFNNLGNVYKNLNEYESATSQYEIAIRLKPNYYEAYNNLGTLLHILENYKKAIEAFTMAIHFNPEFTEAFNNLGLIYYEIGQINNSLNAFKNCFLLNPSNYSLLGNVYYPLMSMKMIDHISYLSYFNDLESIPNLKSTATLALLKLKFGHNPKKKKEAFSEFSSIIKVKENNNIKNPTLNNKNQPLTQPFNNKVFALLQFGRSGTGLLHSMIDNHKQVSVLPGTYFSEYFNPSVWNQITHGGWNEMVDRFINFYPILFDASSSKPVMSINGMKIINSGKKDGLCNLGNSKNEILKVNKEKFRFELTYLLKESQYVDPLKFFKLVHIAYDRAIGLDNKKDILFYHIHNPDLDTKLNFVRLSPNTKWIMLIREPIQSCESWISEIYEKGDYNSVVSWIIQMIYQVDDFVFNENNAIGLRLEDLKINPKKTVLAFCDWLGIDEEQTLYEMTAQGNRWWGDPSSPDYEKDGMKPFGQSSIKRKVGKIFSKRDQFILKTLFYPLRIKFKYTKDSLKKFRNDMKIVRPLLEKMFDFERELIGQRCKKTFMKSGPYLFFRAGLIDRWETLNEFGDYPKMIKPLLMTKSPCYGY